MSSIREEKTIKSVLKQVDHIFVSNEAHLVHVGHSKEAQVRKVHGGGGGENG